jgi:hypothetical protein
MAMTHREIMQKAFTFSRLYLVTSLLALTLSWTFLTGFLTGVGPTPQSPADGYKFERTRATLQWDRGNRQGPIVLQVSMDDPDFGQPLIDRPVKRATHRFENLSPGHTYYWRLIQGEKRSPVASFKTSRNALSF